MVVDVAFHPSKRRFPQWGTFRGDILWRAGTAMNEINFDHILRSPTHLMKIYRSAIKWRSDFRGLALDHSAAHDAPTIRI